MSYYIIKYEFMGQDSAGLRGADRKIQVIKFFEPFGTSRRGIPWARFRWRLPWSFPVLHPERLEELDDLKLDLTAPESC